jgi:hypothetical protein
VQTAVGNLNPLFLFILYRYIRAGNFDTTCEPDTNTTQNREFISDRHGSEVQNYNILKFFFFTNNGMGTSTPIIKSFRPILLTAVTFFKTHRFLYIKILIFLIFFF